MSCRYRRAGVIAALAVCPVMLGAERIAQEPLARVDVLLTTPTELSAIARSSMIEEAAAIWRQHGIALDWLPASAADRAGASHRLRVLVVQKRLAVDPVVEPVAIGQLVRPENGCPVAVISMEAAKHLVSSVRNAAGDELEALVERRLGNVLGRTLAHEIGHYLLDTPTHARTGLMRPNFDASEFTDLRNGLFVLDNDAAAWLHTRTAAKFTYASR